MFSDVGCTLDQDTIEYAWLIEAQMGKISSKLTTPQLYALLASLETLLLLVTDSENELNSPADDALVSVPKIKQIQSNQAQNLQEHVQQAIQQLLQPKNSSATMQKANNQGSVAAGKCHLFCFFFSTLFCVKLLFLSYFLHFKLVLCY